jgi:N-acetyl-anhydromuramyl-L-alanine amidase AmpD
MRKEILNNLWTARWALNKAIDYVERTPEIKDPNYLEGLIKEHMQHSNKALSFAEQIDEPDRPDMPPPQEEEVKYTVPTIVRVPGFKFKKRGQFKTATGNAKGVVVHYTVSGNEPKNARGVISWLSQTNLGCLVMDKDGIIYAPEDYDFQKDVVFHAGQSSWQGMSNMSYYYIGMEICCWGLNSKVGPFRESKGEANIKPGKYQMYTEAQEKSLTNFILWQMHVNPEFKSVMDIVGHDEIAPTRKQDPGASLSMTMPKYREYIKSLLTK